MKRMLLLIIGCVVFGCSSSTSTPTGNRQGDLDASFNTPDGYVLFSGWNKDSYVGTAIQPGGNILVSTGISNGTDSDVGVLRYRSDGTLDTGFGSGGVVIYDGGNGDDCGRLVAVDAGDRIVLTGYTHTGNDDGVLVMRLDDDGTPDSTFGTNGIVVYDNAGRDDYGRAIAIQEDGKILVTARSTGGGTSIAMILRYESDGTLDPSFGIGGVVTYEGGNGNDGFRDLDIQSDGKIVVTGYTKTSEGFEILTARYDIDGTLDDSFGTNGIARYDGGNGNAGARGIALLTDGGMVVSGSSSNGDDLDLVLLKYTSDGSLDPDFGTAGLVVYDGGNGDDNGRRLAVLEGDKIVVAGNTYNGNDYDVLMLRYDSNGVLDPTFGNAGVVSIDWDQGDNWLEGVAIQTDQNIIGVGGIDNGADEILTLRVIGSWSY
jgi:uncharacterized delta-60 repeat protein